MGYGNPGAARGSNSLVSLRTTARAIRVTFDGVQPGEVIASARSPSAFPEDDPKFPTIHVNAMKLDEKPATVANFILFCTHDGDAGVMEILGVSQNPRGVRIRYKRLQEQPPDQWRPTDLLIIARSPLLGPFVAFLVPWNPKA